MKLAGGGDLRLVLAMAGLIVLLFLKGAPGGLPAVEADPGPGAFNAPRAIERLARILGDERPHPADSAANDAVRARLIAEIEALGFAPEIRDDFTCRNLRKWDRVVCARVRNIVFRAGPAVGGDAGKAVMLASHYDSTPAGPGAADDGLGVAVSLEIAARFAATPPARPILFLITDGEELGLLGAHSFVLNDPLADEVESVVNIEARGVRGPGLMFETSVPNGRDVFSYIDGAARPFTNSMMTGVYRLLPNDTDVSEFLPKGYDAVNLALTEGVEFYHTPHDNLANLDARSVQHVGRGALRSLENLLRRRPGGDEGQYAFVDVLSRFSVIVPEWLTVLVLGLAVIAAVYGFRRAGGGRPLRALAAPPAIIVAAAALAFALQSTIGALRPEASYWAAHPEAMRAVIYLSAVAAGMFGVKYVAAGAAPARLHHAGWLWFSLVGAALFAVVPGAAILFALPAAFYLIGALAAPRAFNWTSFVAALLLAAIFLPALHFAEIGLGLGAAPAFAVFAALPVIVIAPLAMRGEARLGVAPVGAAVIGLALASGAALVVPAYSPAKPLPLNIQYYIDADARAAHWLLATPDDAAPEPMAAAAPFAPLKIEGLGDAKPAAKAPYLETSPPEVLVLSDEWDGETRKVRLALIANGADAMFFSIPEDARVENVSSARAGAAFGETGEQLFYCVGRACDETVFDFSLASIAPTDWYLFGLRYGLPRAAAPIVEARPAAATQIQSGDVSIIRKKIKI